MSDNIFEVINFWPVVELVIAGKKVIEVVDGVLESGREVEGSWWELVVHQKSRESCFFSDVLIHGRIMTDAEDCPWGVVSEYYL